jgi:hypothetical protein
MRQYRAPLRGQGTSIVGLYWAGCIINMYGFDLRQAQPAPQAFNPDNLSANLEVTSAFLPEISCRTSQRA